MSDVTYSLISRLPFWNEAEIEIRDSAITSIPGAVRRTLVNINPAWTFHRVEGPVITPLSFLSVEYAEKDMWRLDGALGDKPAYLRPETTASSFQAARHMISAGVRAPLCVWQAGKSYRREKNAGATGAKLRFYEFWQLELQCIYPHQSTKADYKTPAIDALQRQIHWITGQQVRTVPSDRVPAYSEETTDVEAMFRGKWVEMASISIRTDFGEHHRVLELAVGLDRLICARTQD